MNESAAAALPHEIICIILSYMGGSLNRFEFAHSHPSHVDRQLTNDIFSCSRTFKNTCKTWRTAVTQYYRPRCLDLSDQRTIGPTHRSEKSVHNFYKRLALAGFSTAHVEHLILPYSFSDGAQIVPLRDRNWFALHFPSVKFISISLTNRAMIQWRNARELCVWFPHINIYFAGLAMFHPAKKPVEVTKHKHKNDETQTNAMSSSSNEASIIDKLVATAKPNVDDLSMYCLTAAPFASRVDSLSDDETLVVLQAMHELLGTETFSLVNFEYVYYYNTFCHKLTLCS